ncbi:J domain-containing protein [Streptomyces sp. NBC_01750]|uniref:J domain-containing protein n=1 Tax=Streptomyces sp. NBC_01750 TaxID=2975928 RepID=UPI002DD7F3E5|nr:J domain-containing protein [Streptomyces sp. NBC_01750]WSD30924.1 J domain-containing protein [Streptomyces sp. NBC_01750]
MTPPEEIGGPRDPYAVSGVEPNASAARITSAPRRLARDPHPDGKPERSGTYSQFGRRSAPLRAGPTRVDPPANALSAPWSHLPMGWGLLWKWTAG